MAQGSRAASSSSGGAPTRLSSRLRQLIREAETGEEAGCELASPLYSAPARPEAAAGGIRRGDRDSDGNSESDGEQSLAQEGEIAVVASQQEDDEESKFFTRTAQPPIRHPATAAPYRRACSLSLTPLLSRLSPASPSVSPLVGVRSEAGFGEGEGGAGACPQVETLLEEWRPSSDGPRHPLADCGGEMHSFLSSFSSLSSAGRRPRGGGGRAEYERAASSSSWRSRRPPRLAYAANSFSFSPFSSSSSESGEEGGLTFSPPRFARTTRPREETLSLPPQPPDPCIGSAGRVPSTPGTCGPAAGLFPEPLVFREEAIAALAPSSWANPLSRLRRRRVEAESAETAGPPPGPNPAARGREDAGQVDDEPVLSPSAAAYDDGEEPVPAREARRPRLPGAAEEEGAREPRGPQALDERPAAGEGGREDRDEDARGGGGSARPSVCNLRFHRSSSWEPLSSAGSRSGVGGGAVGWPPAAGGPLGAGARAPPLASRAPLCYATSSQVSQTSLPAGRPFGGGGLTDLSAPLALQQQVMRLAEEALHSPEESMQGAGPLPRGAPPPSTACPPYSFTFHESQPLFHLDKTRNPVLWSNGSNAESAVWGDSNCSVTSPQQLSPLAAGVYGLGAGARLGGAGGGGTASPNGFFGPGLAGGGAYSCVIEPCEPPPRRDSTGFWAFTGVWADQDAAAAEFRKIAAARGGNSLMTLHAFRLLVTIFVLLDVIKFGASTCFYPSNHTAFVVFLFLNLGVWLFFLAEALVKLKILGARRYLHSLFTIFDGFLLLVQTAAILLRTVILLDPNGVGKPIFEPESVERADPITNEFTVSRTHMALLALDTIQLFRVYRLTFSCRELFLLTKSVLHSLRSLQWTALFVFCVIYTCAIFCTWTFYDADDAEMSLLWGNLVLSMFTLFTVLTLEGWNGVANSTAEKHPFSRIFFVCFICFTTLTLLNIVTGIILDAYVDMSSRLAAEASYHEHLEKDARNEDLLTKAFQQTDFLFSLPAGGGASALRNWNSLSRSSVDGSSKFSPAFSGPARKKANEEGSFPAGGAPPDSGGGGGGAPSGDPCGAAPPRASSAARGDLDRAPSSWAGAGGGGAGARGGAKLERKTTGLTSECSTTARPPTEGNEGLQVGGSDGDAREKEREREKEKERREDGDKAEAVRKGVDYCDSKMTEAEDAAAIDGDEGAVETEDGERERAKHESDEDRALQGSRDTAWDAAEKPEKRRKRFPRFFSKVGSRGLLQLGRHRHQDDKREKKKDESECREVACLNLGSLHPLDILQHPAILDALEKADIPLFQAFDVLNLYYTRGVEFITVKEFAESCNRVCGTSTGRQLLQMQIDLHQKLNRVERRVRRLAKALVQQQQLILQQQLHAMPSALFRQCASFTTTPSVYGMPRTLSHQTVQAAPASASSSAMPFVA
ncbi:transporter, cation channel family protein [Besnoitia besnoiti]|uniref:Transporter, cation channel family protein n=1 Tax=Besnoitia besnoiti TaxID=94643 RepID=A0A2A9M786_BESBE|nr:transporter, cation channel family protein [Besnoitia besnoiti]PFH31507.1 transporter, cation channel family protein [Besnoitia besnoiti]